MCEEVDGCCPVWSRSEVRSRKAHMCTGCNETIMQGQSYVRTSALYDGHWSNWKHCQRCDAMIHAIDDANRARGEFVVVDAGLDCGELWDEVFGSTPEHIQALAFWLPGEPLPSAAAREEAGG